MKKDLTICLFYTMMWLMFILLFVNMYIIADYFTFLFLWLIFGILFVIISIFGRFDLYTIIFVFLFAPFMLYFIWILSIIKLISILDEIAGDYK